MEPLLRDLQSPLERRRNLRIYGVPCPAQAFLGRLLGQMSSENRTVLMVAATAKEQEGLQQDLQTWLNCETNTAEEGLPEARESPLFFPGWDVLPQENQLPHADVLSERLESLVALSSGSPNTGPRFVVSAVTALMQPTFSPAELQDHARQLRRGEQCDPLDLVEWLEDQSYEPEAQVTQKGEISLRGGILDVYPLTSPWPVRLEFFGDELESLRFFDPHTQISRESIESIQIPPAGELGLLRARAAVGNETDCSLIDYLPANSLVVLLEPDQLDEAAAQYESQVPPDHPLLHPWDAVRRQLNDRQIQCVELLEEVASDLDESATAEREDSDPAGNPLPPVEVQLAIETLDAYRPILERIPDSQVVEAQRRAFFAQLHRWLRQGLTVSVFCNNEGERQRFEEIWAEYGLPTSTDTPGEPLALRLQLGALSRGFLWGDTRLVVITDAEIFGRYRSQRPRRLKSAHAVAARSALAIDFTDLEEGDYVVHIQHGIGRYLGLKTLPTTTGRQEAKPDTTDAGQECLVIEYAPRNADQPPPRLYVPITEAHLVSKYVGAGKAQPPLNTLGGTRWTKTKEQAERAIQDFAAGLLAVQAARESEQGFAYGPDTPWQREFEAAFLYEETPDQHLAIQQSKQDMESVRPMDRLICGDVGFGKTEVAIRAAFKAVMSGKQVAILVPTTVLAQQHYNTLRERMADYPVRIDLLSRFRTRREQQRTLQDLATGAVDIVVGTHRLLGKDVAIKDLGLVVIDEEQRFGVAHKEKLKEVRRLVDVLTLTATPIPRTLYLALTGARDMSTIETPPQDRLPVETVVAPYDERVIRDSIRRELNRGGQVFFLHNRVTTILTVAQKLQNLLPDARIVVGHGQMRSDDLEDVMTRFINGEADILLSTTIIESGIDIPNANTIIIDRADRFGLSDLYQLRGRVGRYKHQAYAYFLLPRHAGLLADARKRISAIKQYSTLGSGFKIAMRDLEIRGAGNLLGPEQSGHITAVGFELYCQLLKQTVAVLKGEKPTPRVDVEVRLDFLALNPGEESRPKASRQIRPTAPSTLDVPAEAKTPSFISSDYIAEPRQRIEVYRKLAQATETELLDTLRREVIDRFGPLPAAVELLFLVGELKILASQRNVTAIESREGRLMLTRNGDYLTLGGKFPRLSRKQPKAKLNEIRRLLLSL